MNEDRVRDELVALLEAALQPYFDQSDATAYAELFAPEATYFDPNSAGKISGNAISRHFEGFRGQIPPLHYEILNPSVDLFGDLAVFTLNLNTFDKTDGSLVSRWNTTQIHRRSEGGWGMVHAHWSYAEVPA